MKSINANVCILGIGLSGCSLALALLDKGYTGQIVMCEKEKSVNSHKTWCFWNERLIPQYLQDLIVKRWSSWNVSSQSRVQSHHVENSNLQYCCIRAKDFFDYALNRLSQAKNVSLLFGVNAKPLEGANNTAEAVTDNHRISANFGFDSRNAPQLPMKEGMYQCFAGAWIRSDKPLFDDSCAQLMSEMHSIGDGLEFTYKLPINQFETLIEVTRFSRNLVAVDDIKNNVLKCVNEAFNDSVRIIDWEGGILPMKVGANPNALSDNKQWIKMGVAAGQIRASTGYAFLTIQKFSAYAANRVLLNKRPTYQHTSALYEWLDKVFLRVLSQSPELAPTIFLSMINGTKPSQFARFMSESATISDVARIVFSMPKRPFIKAIW